jgi:arsenical pump membrane protein
VLLGIAHANEALEQAWPPFVLVAGLLVLGELAGADGLFEAAASRLQRTPAGPAVTLLACLGLVALVTAILNLDTAAVFLTPVLIAVARRRGIAEAPFLYGTVFMANASSLYLPGSNLTNLLVLSDRHKSGVSFLIEMLPAALAATAVTAGGVLALHRRVLVARTATPSEAAVPVRAGAGLLGAVLAAVLMLALANPALPVLALALALLLWRASRNGARALRDGLRALGLPVLGSLFLLTVGLGIAARSGLVPLGWLRSAGDPATAGVAALASVAINNLPAAVLMSATGGLHPQALLIGLNAGPNLLVTGSLAVLLWWRSARAAGARPSALEYSRQGLLLAPAATLAALLAAGLI